MEKEFYFDQVRNSIEKYNQIVIQGYGEDKYMKDCTLVAMYNGKKTNSRFVVTKAPFYKKSKKITSGSVKMLSFIVELPKERIKRSDILSLYKEKADGTKELIHTLNGKKIIVTRKTLKSVINVVSASGKKMYIKGWAGYCKKPETALYDAKTNQVVETKINWYERADIDVLFPESSKEKNLGFVVELENTCDKYKLIIKSGNSTMTYKVKAVSQNGNALNIYNLRYAISKVVFSISYCGFKGTWTKILNHLFPGRAGKGYNKWLKKNTPSDRIFAKQEKEKFRINPKFSIIVPLYESEEKYLNELVDSIKQQTYSNWEICFSDGSKSHDRLEKIVGMMSLEDDRIKYIAKSDRPLGISDNTNQALEIATGDYIVLGDHDDLLTRDALYECVKAINEDPDRDVIYTDEDKVDSKGKNFTDPHFKPDMNIDFLRSCNYICHMFVCSKEVLEKAGKFNNEYDGSQDYDFILRCVEQATKVHHIPKILYHWRVHSESTASMPEVKMYCYESARKALNAHYKRLGIDAEATMNTNLGYYKTRYNVSGEPKVSIVIANKDHSDDLKKCLDSIFDKTTYKNYEIIVVENNSVEEETFKYYEEIEKLDNVKVCKWDKEFNYSAVNNFGVKNATGEYILLLNNDVEVIEADWLREMLSVCQREDVGAVGARLYFEDDTIQHAGIIVGLGGIAAHAFLGMDEDDTTVTARITSSCDYSAVTAACLMVSRKDYEDIGGLDEEYTVALNDVDFCLRLREKGLLVVYDANARLYHYESKSRGKDDTVEKMERFKSESARLKKRFADVYKNGDPCYNPNLTLFKHDFSIKMN